MSAAASVWSPPDVEVDEDGVIVGAADFFASTEVDTVGVAVCVAVVVVEADLSVRGLLDHVRVRVGLDDVDVAVDGRGRAVVGFGLLAGAGFDVLGGVGTDVDEGGGGGGAGGVDRVGIGIGFDVEVGAGFGGFDGGAGGGAGVLDPDPVDDEELVSVLLGRPRPRPRVSVGSGLSATLDDAVGLLTAATASATARVDVVTTPEAAVAAASGPTVMAMVAPATPRAEPRRALDIGAFPPPRPHRLGPPPHESRCVDRG